MKSEDEARQDFRRNKYARIFADFAVPPAVWTEDGGAVEAEHLPISAALQKRYEIWWYWYQERMLTNEGLGGPDPATFDMAAHAREGRAIAGAMKRELPDWRVVYVDQFTRWQAGNGAKSSAYTFEIA